MSIRQSPHLTPELLDAARSNARHSTGPRSEAGKQNCRMNALKHGERSDPENHYDVMRALGEDPARFEALKQELSASFDTSDAFAEKQVDDLALLYWRRDRLERVQTGLARRALLALEDREHRRRKEIEGVTMEVDQGINTTIAEPSDPAARLRLRLSFLALIRLQVHLRSFLPWQAAALDRFYQKKGGWRAARLCWLLALFAWNTSRTAQGDAPPEGGGGSRTAPTEVFDEDEGETGGADVPLLGMSATRGWQDSGDGHEIRPCDSTEPADEPRYNELVLLLADEVAALEKEFEYEEELHEERAAIERDACLAPSGEEWRLLMRREESLDRAIDRKIRILLSLRKEALKGQKPQSPNPRDSALPPAPASDVGAPLVGTQAEGRGGSRTAPTEICDEEACQEARPDGDVNEQPSPEPSPEGRGCQAPALSSAGA